MHLFLQIYAVAVVIVTALYVFIDYMFSIGRGLYNPKWIRYHLAASDILLVAVLIFFVVGMIRIIFP